MKTWSYKEVTEEAERKILTLIDDGKSASGEFEKELCRHWAYGVYLGWNSLTMGWQNEGDDERLKALACNTD